MKRRILFVAASALLLIVAACQKMTEQPASPDPAPSLKSASLQNSNNFVPGEMLVKFKNGTTMSRKEAILQMLGGKIKENILTRAMQHLGDKEGVTLVSLPGAALEAIGKVRGMPEIEYAEPNFIYTHQLSANDPYFTNKSLWGMYGETSASPISTANGSHAADAWANGHTGSATVFVGIIDEGYMYTHPELAANAGVNPGEIANNGVDDDGNGYIDDVYGWDFDGNNNTVFDGVGDDHGTHVAGTIGAVGNNGVGVAGICWTIRILNAKFLGRNGGTTANAIKAVDYFTDLKTRSGINLVATNNSWGGGGFSQALQDAIGRANDAGILFVAAAGNGGSDGIGDNNDNIANYPSNYPNDNVIAVAAITSSGTLASFSNYGATTVDLGAPGSGIYSTVPVSSKGKIVPGYASYSGTSMATPHVTGACALYASTHPGETAAQIKAAILKYVTPNTKLAGNCVSGGSLNVSGF